MSVLQEKARAAHQVKLGIVEQQKKSFDAMISEFEKSRLETLKARILPLLSDIIHSYIQYCIAE